MKTKIRILIAFVLLSAAALTILFGSPNAQPSGNPQTEPEVSVPSIVSTSTDTEETRTLATTIVPTARYGWHIDLNQPGVTLEQLDAQSLTLESNQIGINRSVAVSPNTRAQKFVNPDGSQTIALIIKSSGASGIGVHFRNFALADGEEVYVYGAATDSIVFGPFTDKGPWGTGEFWSGTVDGDTVVIEFYKRANENGQGFEIFEISHILAELDWRLRSNETDVLNCEVDASCYSDAEKNAVARIMFNDNGGTYLCTGTLLDDIAQDQCPYFLTANHCVDSQAVAETVEAYWFYQTTSCESNVLRPWVHSPPGTDLLKTGTSNDFSLLRLLSTPPRGVVYSGWTAGAQSIGTSVFGLHHPGEDTPPDLPSYLRMSVGSITGTNYNCPTTGMVSGYRIHWTDGTIEGGSSGSGLFTTVSHELVGVLSCGSYQFTCTNPAFYSKFSNFYSQIEPYIGSGSLATPTSPVANPATLVAGNSFTANWREVSGATGYRLDVSRSSSFNTYVAGYHNLDVHNATSGSVTGLNASTTYYYRVRAYSCNGTSGNSNVVHVTTPGASGVHVSSVDHFVEADSDIDTCPVEQHHHPQRETHSFGTAAFDLSNAWIHSGITATGVGSNHATFVLSGSAHGFAAKLPRPEQCPSALELGGGAAFGVITVYFDAAATLHIRGTLTSSRATTSNSGQSSQADFMSAATTL
jgi:Trypsin-like peptidase domain/Fibronectin type III domain